MIPDGSSNFEIRQGSKCRDVWSRVALRKNRQPGKGPLRAQHSTSVRHIAIGRSDTSIGSRIDALGRPFSVASLRSSVRVSPERSLEVRTGPSCDVARVGSAWKKKTGHLGSPVLKGIWYTLPGSRPWLRGEWLLGRPCFHYKQVVPSTSMLIPGRVNFVSFHASHGSGATILGDTKQGPSTVQVSIISTLRRPSSSRLAEALAEALEFRRNLASRRVPTNTQTLRYIAQMNGHKFQLLNHGCAI